MLHRKSWAAVRLKELEISCGYSTRLREGGEVTRLVWGAYGHLGPHRRSTDLVLFQESRLYISDPRALHSILVKDQYVFEETAQFLEYVFFLLAAKTAT